MARVLDSRCFVRFGPNQANVFGNRRGFRSFTCEMFRIFKCLWCRSGICEYVALSHRVASTKKHSCFQRISISTQYIISAKRYILEMVIACIKRESNPRRVDKHHGNDPGYHYPINAHPSSVIMFTGVTK